MCACACAKSLGPRTPLPQLPDHCARQSRIEENIFASIVRELKREREFCRTVWRRPKHTNTHFRVSFRFLLAKTSCWLLCPLSKSSLKLVLPPDTSPSSVLPGIFRARRLVCVCVCSLCAEKKKKKKKKRPQQRNKKEKTSAKGRVENFKVLSLPELHRPVCQERSEKHQKEEEANKKVV